MILSRADSFEVGDRDMLCGEGPSNTYYLYDSLYEQESLARLPSLAKRLITKDEFQGRAVTRAGDVSENLAEVTPTSST